MCGITGYVGNRNAVETVINNLKRLEYRGYDSSGVACLTEKGLEVARAVGKIANLERVLDGHTPESHTAISHTRWATHGKPSERNAHPHRDSAGKLAVVHNGIIENYAELREELISEGVVFASETDTEVLPQLIARELTRLSTQISAESFAHAIRVALSLVRGSYALAILCADLPDTVFVARKDSPLVVGVGEGENFIASDISAVIRYTRNVLLLEDGEFGIITPNKVTLLKLDGQIVAREIFRVTWDDAAAEKGGYAHFMLKEIYENPRTVRETLRTRLLEDGTISLPGVPFTPAKWTSFKRIAIVGCGTAYHAGVVGKRFFERILRRPVTAEVASEFRYGDPILDAETLVILISQSGETADTLAAMREAKSKGATTLAVVNVVGSTLARDADAVLLTQAGPEIGVASTKAYLAQLTALSLIGLYFAQVQGATLTADYAVALRELPSLLERCLQKEPEIIALAEALASSSCFFYLGRGYDFDTSLEAALKLKEISYIHAEAYPAGEMKHGPLALVEPGVSVIGFCTQTETEEKMISNLKEVKAREGTVVAVLREGAKNPDCADYTLFVPGTLDPLMPIVSMVSMQILAYHVARLRGCEIDQPRNLAKSVTVE